MEPELKALEEKVAQFIQLCQQLRAENSKLRQQLAAEQGQSKQLSDKINSATARLEAILHRIPGESQ